MNDFYDPFGLVDARRSTRLTAFGIDTALGVAACLPVFVTGDPIDTSMMAIFSSPLLILLTIVQTILLSRTGQTLGKRAIGIQIVDIETGHNGGFVTNVMKRTILNWVLCFIPIYSLIDTLFSFRPDRRCIHDYLASTRVVYK